MLDIADRLAIHELLALYGHLIDERQWSRLDEIMVADLRYDATDFDLGVTHTLDELRTAWMSDKARHPLAHHATNVVVSEHRDGTVRVLSKGVGVGYAGRVGSVTYRDIVVKTPEGWKFAERVLAHRSPDRIPDPT